MDLAEHIPLVYPRWLRTLVGDPETIPAQTAAFYVSGESARATVLSVAPHALSVTEFSWGAARMEGQFVEAQRISVPLSVVERVELVQAIGGLAANGGQPEHFDARASITMRTEFGSLGNVITLPISDDDYAHNPDRRADVLRFFLDSLTALLT